MWTALPGHIREEGEVGPRLDQKEAARRRGHGKGDAVFVGEAVVRCRGTTSCASLPRTHLRLGGYAVTWNVSSISWCCEILLGYISKQLGGCSVQPAKRVSAEPTDVFRIDAKAEGEKIVIGGWESYKGQETSQARWFSIELNRRNAAWAYVKGDPFRSIASLELVGVLTAVMLFAPEADWRGGRTRVTITAVTDNLGNTFVMQKFASCKFPLSIVVMELACQLKKRSMALRWIWAGCRGCRTSRRTP